MHLKINLASNRKIVLKKSYNHLIQALIYNLLDKNFAEWLHTKGFKYENRFFRHFAFSSILERASYNKEAETFTFQNEISFILSSPVDHILEQFARNAITKEEIKLGNNALMVNSVEILPQPPIKENKIRINTLSPIEVHSTLEKKDGAKKTYYFAPSENEFNELINANLQKKWKAYYLEDCEYRIEIEPVKKEYLKRRILNYKDFIVQGWHGHFWIKGEPEFLQFSLDTGLGSRNSQGFGCIERVFPK